jgi:TPP-dependent pyruvate/acetoin dehydrogenase alpha subunit
MYDRFYRSLYRIRRVEEEISRIYPTDKIKSPVHLSNGQEAVSVGVCEALRRDDIVFGTYRSHALYLAKGGDLKRMIAELYGKVTGVARGKGGSMHLIDTAAGVMGTSAVVATTIPQAVGYAYALKLQRRNPLVASFFGDGAVEEGAFHESMNFAALKKLPIIFICENNLYAIQSYQLARQAKSNICERAQTYGMPAERIEDNDVLRIYERVKQAVHDLRNGGLGPRFFECMTYRRMEHVGPNEDFHTVYPSREEAEPWHEKDQVKLIGNLVDPVVRRNIEGEVEAEIHEAFEFAEQSPFPNDEELYAHVFEGE